MIIAIDGPAGSGKGALTKEIEKRLGFTRIDTGAMYRCITLKMQRNSISLDDEIGIQNILNNTDIKFMREGAEVKVLMDGEDVSTQIRTQEVNNMVSPVSAIIIIRKKMVELQQAMKNDYENIVMEGRDITTVVFPEAEIKIYLTATMEERARRRYLEMSATNSEITYEEVLDSMQKRDANDKAKEMGALKIADDAIILDNTNLTIEQTVDEIERIIEEKKNG